MEPSKPANEPGVRRERRARIPCKKYTVRLPLALASRLEALCEMHPLTTRSQLIGDLLGLGLAEVERARSGISDTPTVPPPAANPPIYLLTGPFSEFHHLTYKHHLALEHALSKEDAQDLRPIDEYTLGDSE